ncbi:MAG: undecaprenyl/decaprenyl-phosphate alpha-N-acetylglucosaminyl 1-phosphate transferase [Flavobacteriales bacterium]|nr:undecaprenyl/decaprenyl-phosphate alpha-N-acetylglucosaminyl 1-phosphate transferase [Flavobacteriales bacterium]
MEEKYQIFITYATFFIGITAFSLLLNSIFLKFAKTLGIRDKKETVIRWSSEVKPALGGISFFICFLIAAAIFSIFFGSDSTEVDNSSLGIIFATSMAFLMGMADDAYDTRPFLKFSVQMLCGLVLITTGSSIQIFGIDWLNDIFTLVWVVGMMNSINMLDNMDAISSLVSLFILLLALIYMALHGMQSTLLFMVLIGVIGSIVGFLFYNWHPSKIYMGDTGSQFLGILLAAVGIKFCWNATSIDGDINASRQIITVLLVFILPLIDTTIVTINRIGRGSSPFVGGKDHTTHNLGYLGLSDSQVAFVFAGIAIISGLLVYYIFRFVKEWNHYITIGFLAYFLIIFFTLFLITRHNMKKGKLST